MSVTNALYCINPDCHGPHQAGNNRFCTTCGTSLCLNNRYLPLKKLGAGGFAAIYTVWDLQSQEEKVLKVLTVTSPKARQLFEQEAEVMATLNHPGIPKVERGGYFYLKQGGNQLSQLPCLVMEKINGQTLEDILDKYPQGCPEELVYDWLRQGIEILQELHQRHIIHRDIKPSNLMLRTPSPPRATTPGKTIPPLSPSAIGMAQLVLIDFGGAKHTGLVQGEINNTSTRLFSSGYSPPEQISGHRVAPATDFYALGRTAIHLLTGKHPLELEDIMTGELQWRQEAKVGDELANLLDNLVRVDARQRPPTEEISQRLNRLPQPASTHSPSPTLIISAPAFTQFSQQVGQQITQKSGNLLAGVGKAIKKSLRLSWDLVWGTTVGLIDTIGEIIFGILGTSIGATVGFVLTYATVLGSRMELLASTLFPGGVINEGAEAIIFAMAGLGAAWGLTLPGGFGQRRRFLLSGLLAMVGYGMGWLLWQATPLTMGERFLVLVSATAVSLTLGLGLSSHRLAHIFVGGLGSWTILASCVKLGFLPVDVLQDILSFAGPLWLDFIQSIILFILLVISLGLSLGVSHYLLVPILRQLGWK
ncbi:MAG: serine/threonine-protein kinase [Spirulinaceae cyanobacterium]